METVYLNSQTNFLRNKKSVFAIMAERKRTVPYRIYQSRHQKYCTVTRKKLYNLTSALYPKEMYSMGNTLISTSVRTVKQRALTSACSCEALNKPGNGMIHH